MNEYLDTYIDIYTSILVNNDVFMNVCTCIQMHVEIFIHSHAYIYIFTPAAGTGSGTAGPEAVQLAALRCMTYINQRDSSAYTHI